MNISTNHSWTAITYPQDFSDEGLGLGEKTIYRLRKIVDVKQDRTYNIQAIVLASGFGPDRDEYPNQHKSFEAMMAEWLISEGKISKEIIHCSNNPKVWNCIEMTLEMIHIMKTRNLPKNVLIVSNYHHIYPRMWTTWMLLCGKKYGWRLAFCPENNGTSKFFHEIGGTVKYIPMALWHRHSI